MATSSQTKTHSSLRIAIDASVATRPFGGISEYTYRILEELGQIDHRNQYSLLTYGYNLRTISALPDLPPTFHRIHKRWPPVLVNTTWRYLDFPKVTSFLPPHDVFFAPHFLLPAGDFKRLVVTIHDVLFLDHPEWFLAQDVRYFTNRLQRAMTLADHVLTVSQASQDALVRHNLCPEKKITVTPLGVDYQSPAANDLARIKKAYHLPENYLLYLGTIEPRKNILRQLEAYALLEKEGMTIPFVLAGRRGWLGPELEETVERLGLASSVRFLGGFPREDRAAILAGADCLLFPSLGEGFGLPVLEGMAAGVPVITSTVSSLPEVAGDAALLVDPTDVTALAQAIRRVVGDPKLAQTLRTRGKDRARAYTWRQTAERTKQVLEEVA